MIEDEGVRFRFENAYEAGRDFERGRQSAFDREPNYELADRIRLTLDQVEQVNDLIRQINQAVSSRDSVPEQKISAGWWVLIAFVALLLCRSSVFFGVGFALLAGCVLTYLNEKHSRERNQIISQRQEYLDELYTELETVKADGSELSLPQKYMNTEALDHLYSIVISCRAFSMQQAINCYEDDLHKREMEKLQKEQLAAQRQQIDLQQRQVELMESNKPSGDGIGKAIVGAGVALAGLALFGKWKR
ncbi:MAG: hypothetical protein IJQ36_05795 [Oscillospiraceae bacterium]|nr:hypothetical protein [Oscillospiraceae bacterium]MBQ7143747.1 hypothetical protein [Oscillospiraceae bacterium]